MDSPIIIDGRRLNGWLYRRENRTALRTYGRDFLRHLPPVGADTEQLVDPADFLKMINRVEDQAEQGSCAGASLTYIAEWSNRIDSGGASNADFSMSFSYNRAQHRDGLYGQGDTGATIHGATQAAMMDGFCLESSHPYTRTYNPRNPSQAAIEEGLRCKMLGRQPITSYNDVRRVLGSLTGGVQGGILISEEFMRQTSGIIRHLRPTPGMGHAQAWLCLSTNKTSDGRPWVIQPGTWGTRHGNRGINEWHPDLIEQCIRDPNSEFQFTTDIEELIKRTDDDPPPDIDLDKPYIGRTIDFEKNPPYA